MFTIRKSDDRYTMVIKLSTAKEMYLLSRALGKNNDESLDYHTFIEQNDIRCGVPYYHTENNGDIKVLITFTKYAYIESTFNFDNKDVMKVKKFIQKAMKRYYYGC